MTIVTFIGKNLLEKVVKVKTAEMAV